ncbi:MAG: pitrilysin family protein [Candidatus Woesearchaeota archaeon]
MESYRLKNGLKVILDRRATKTVAVEVNVKVGSNYETNKLAGISHFIEHLVFDGTKKRPTAMQISNEIERLGGEFNAATSNERTFYYIKVLSKHIEIALDILSDIIFNPEFSEENIEKEKRIIIDEINLVNDQPRHYQWIFFQKNLFVKHPAKNPIYGSTSAIKGIGRNDILGYYNTHYIPDNITLVIVGGFRDSIKERISFYFGSHQRHSKNKSVFKNEPEQKKTKIVRTKLPINQSYIVLGYKTPPRHSKESYVLDVIRAILGRGQSGKLFDEIRNKLGLAYDVGVYHNPNVDFGVFAVYASTQKKHIKKIVSIIQRQIQELRHISKSELETAKNFLEGEFLLHTEDNQRMADVLAFWDTANCRSRVEEYIKSIKRVSCMDVANTMKKYLGKNYTLVVLEQK